MAASAHPSAALAEERESYNITMEEAAKTIFAEPLKMLSIENRDFVMANLKGAWIIQPGDPGHPSQWGHYAYVTDIGSKVMYFGAENLSRPKQNARVLCHEAAHGAGHGHDQFLFERQDSCERDVAAWEINRFLDGYEKANGKVDRAKVTAALLPAWQVSWD